MSIDAMKQALEFLEFVCDNPYRNIASKQTAVMGALRAAIEQAQPETELETYKRLYELRGKALERPCISCGYQPKKIKTMAQPEPAPGYCKHCKQYSIEKPLPSQPDQKPVFELGFGWLDDATKYPRGAKLYTAPRQWQSLTQREIDELWDLHHDDCGNALSATGYERAIETKLKEKNT